MNTDLYENALLTLREYYRNLDFRNRALMSLLDTSDIRVEELCNLQIKDVNLHKRSIVVEPNKKYGRILIINKDCQRYLKEYINQHPTKKGSLFLTRKGDSPLSPRVLSFIVREIGKRAGISSAVTPFILKRMFKTAKN